VEFWEEERGGIGHLLASQGFPNLENGKRESVFLTVGDTTQTCNK